MTTPGNISLILVDDHQVVLDGLSAVLGTDPALEILRTFTSGTQCLSALAGGPLPQVVVMDVQMPEMDGYTLCQAVTEQFPQVAVLALSMNSSGPEIRRMLQAGAKGYVLKEAPKDELIRAIKAVAQGQNFYSAGATQAVMHSLQGDGVPVSAGPPVRLTPREKEILKLIANERSTPEIAEELSISENTVETHRKNLISIMIRRMNLWNPCPFWHIR